MEHWIKSLDDGNDVDIIYFARHLTVFHTNAYCQSWKFAREFAWSSPHYYLYKWLTLEVVQNNIAIFADDTQFYIFINTPDNSPTI